jgi:hypothetical protein
LRKLNVGRQDLAIIIVLSIVFFLISVWNLGERDVPLRSAGFNTAGGESFYLELEDIERVVYVNLLLKTRDSVSLIVYTGTPETFLCGMKTGLDGRFYIPNVGESVLKIELLFDDENLVGDQAGGVAPSCMMITYPDGKVDETDVSFVKSHQGLVENVGGWNHMADIVPDKSINSMDLESVFNNYGKTGSYIKNLTRVSVKFDTGGERTPDNNGFVAIPFGARSFNITRDDKPVGAMVTFWKSMSISLNGYYCWRSIYINSETHRIGFILGPSSGEIVEIVVIGVENRILPISSIGGRGINEEALRKLIDEQDKIEYPPTYLTETYFDEIYFVRTAEEYIRFEEPYENVHPPLGKLIIAAGILVFGYNPFGWRIMGVIFATLMVPIMYFLGKELFEKEVAAFMSAFLWVFEFMHFTMGRIGTVDTYVLFFSLLSHIFFFTYLKGVLKNRADNRLLFLAIFFFSLGFSTKWIVLFGFFGNVFLLIVFRLKDLSKIETSWASRISELIHYPISSILSFLIIGILIYFLTFIPYMMVGHTLLDVFSMQFGMYRYHATLKATHPFASPWWSWPLMQTPVWLYVSYLPNRMVSTITCMGNPAIWWLGVLGLMFVSMKTVLKKNFVCLYIVTIFLFQWLFYIPISRCVFLYHFYSDVPFLILAITAMLNDFWRSKNTKYGKAIIIAYLTIVVIVFLLFYPVISGLPCPIAWKDSLRLLDSWIF